MPQQFRKKPVVIEAEQYQGRNDIAGVCRRMDCAAQGISKPHVHTIHNNQAVLIEKGDWIIPEPDGLHFYPCKPDIFEATYESVGNPPSQPEAASGGKRDWQILPENVTHYAKKIRAFADEIESAGFSRERGKEIAPWIRGIADAYESRMRVIQCLTQEPDALASTLDRLREENAELRNERNEARHGWAQRNHQIMNMARALNCTVDVVSEKVALLTAECQRLDWHEKKAQKFASHIFGLLNSAEGDPEKWVFPSTDIAQEAADYLHTLLLVEKHPEKPWYRFNEGGK